MYRTTTPTDTAIYTDTCHIRDRRDAEHMTSSAWRYIHCGRKDCMLGNTPYLPMMAFLPYAK